MTRDRDERPRTRGDCLHGLRPCPWVACRYHLAEPRDDNGRLRLNVLDDELALTATDSDVECFTELAADAVVAMRETCALDVADRNPDGATLDVSGQSFGLTRERMRQIEHRAVRSLRRTRGRRLL